VHYLNGLSLEAVPFADLLWVPATEKNVNYFTKDLRHETDGILESLGGEDFLFGATIEKCLIYTALSWRAHIGGNAKFYRCRP
jgi:hypothetical protein